MESSETPYSRVPSSAKHDGSPAVCYMCAGKYATLAVCLGVFLVQYSQSQAMIAPFIAASVPGQLIGGDSVGIVFAAYPLATALATPLPPIILRRCALRTMVATGLVLTGVANLSFGAAGAFAESLDVGLLTLGLIGFRALGGMGAALSEAGCLIALTGSGWGAHLGKVLSLVEVTTGLGAALGAAMGGWLYHVGEFLLPMLVGAALPLCVAPLVLTSLPPTANSDAGVDEAEAGGGDDGVAPPAPRFAREAT